MGSSHPSELSIEFITESDVYDLWTIPGQRPPPPPAESSVRQSPSSHGSSFSLVKVTPSINSNNEKDEDAESVRSFAPSVGTKSELGLVHSRVRKSDCAASVRSSKSSYCRDTAPKREQCGRLNAKIGGSSSNVSQRRFSKERPEEYLWPIYVGNVPAGAADELRDIFYQFGEFASPDVVINLTEFYALVNFKSANSMERALAYDKPIFVRGHKLEVKPANGSSAKLERTYSTEETSRVDSLERPCTFLSTEKPYAVVLVKKLSEDMSREHLLDMFREFGKIVDPPGITVYKDKRQATIPYRNKYCAEKLVRVTSGRFYVSRWCTLRLSLLDHTPRPESSVRQGATSRCSSSTSAKTTPNSQKGDDSESISSFTPSISAKSERGLVHSRARKSDCAESVRSSKSSYCSNTAPKRKEFERSNAKFGGSSSNVSKSSSCKTSEEEEMPFTIVLVENLTEDLSREHLIAMFRDYGTIADPPSIKVDTKKRRATIPYRFKHCAEKLLRVTNGHFYVNRRCILRLSLLEHTPEDFSSINLERFLAASPQESACPTEITGWKKRPNGIAEFFSDIESESDKTILSIQETEATETENFETFEPVNHRSCSAQKSIDREDVIKFLKNDDNFEEIVKVITMENVLTATAEKPLQAEEDNGLQIRIFSDQKLTSGEVLRMHLTSSDRSHGGEIVEFDFDKSSGRGLVKYADRSVTARVLNKPNGHTLEKCTLYVTKLPPVQPKCFFLTNVPVNVPDYSFNYYLGARFLCGVQSVVFRHDNSAALVTLAEEKDFERLRADLRQNPFRFNDGENTIVLDIAQVRYPDAVVVHGSVPSEDGLRLKLEEYLRTKLEIKNKENFAAVKSKSNADRISNLVRYVVPIIKSTPKSSDPESPPSTLLIFEDYRAVPLLEDHVTLDGRAYKLTSFYDCLGFSPATDEPNFLRNHGESKLVRSLTELQTAYFRVEANLHKLRRQIRSNDLQCHLNINADENQLIIVAANKNASSIVEQFIFANLHTLKFTLDPYKQKSIRDNKATVFDIEMQKLEACYQITNVDRLEIVSFMTNVDQLKSIVNDFFQTYTLYKICLTRSNLEAHYLKKYHTVDLRMEFMHRKVEFQWADGYRRLYVNASKKMLSIFRQMINESLKDTETIEYTVKRPGMSNYFRDSPKDLNSIMESTMTVISFDYETIVPDENYDHDELGQSETLNFSSECLLDGWYQKKVRLMVVSGDITAQDVDCIVNAANEQLLHSGGLAEIIVKRGGECIQKECTDHVKKNGDLALGEVYASGPGRLPCKRVIHAVGPRWRQGTMNEEKYLRLAVQNALIKADNLQMTSIAISAISTGVFRYPIDQAVAIIIHVILFMCASLRYVKEVRFIDLKRDILDIAVGQLREAPGFEQNSVEPEPTNEETITATPSVKEAEEPMEYVPSTFLPEVIPISRTSLQKPETSGTGTGNGTASANRILTVNGCQILVVKDEMVKYASNCDVVVNSTGTNLTGGGESAKALLAAGGQPLLDDIKTKYPNGLGSNIMATTKAGSLPCKHIFHVACSDWNPSNSPQELKDRLFACLNEANKLQFTSIAFPAIGTGGSNYPCDACAALMLADFSEWLQTTNSHSVQKIAVVLYPKDARPITAFDKEYARLLNGGTPASTTNYFSPVGKTPTTELSAVQIGSVKVEIVHGDLSKESSDCIICPAQDPLDLNQGQVVVAVKNAGGKRFEDLVENCREKFTKKVLILPTDGLLPANHVLFMDSPFSNGDQWLAVLCSAFELANTSKCASVSVPLVGTGNRSLNAEKMTEIMFESIRNVAGNAKLQLKINLIRIVIFQQSIYSQVCGYISQLEKTTRKKTWKAAVTGYLANKVRGFFGGNETSDVEIRSSTVEIPLTLFIYGKKRAVRDAQRQLDALCEEKCPERIVRNDVIEHLTQDQVSQFKSEAAKMLVDLDIDRVQKKAKLRGLKAAEFREYLSDYLSKLSTEFQAFNLQDDTVFWYAKQAGSFDWTPLSTVSVNSLERAFKDADTRKTAELLEFEGHADAAVDFSTMTVKIGQNSAQYDVKRKLATDEIPVHWDWTEDCKDAFRLVAVNDKSQEYSDVQSAIVATSNVNVLSVERVENVKLYKQYLVEKHQMEAAVPAGVIAERKLFHGTADKNVPGVCNNGFNRSLAGINGVAYGHGSYFARDFSYSQRYGKKIFYCYVLTGQFCVGNESMKVAPDLDAAKGLKYISTVDNVNNPSIFVIYCDTRAYPAYVVTIA